MMIVYPGFSGSSLGTTSIFGVCPSTPSLPSWPSLTKTSSSSPVSGLVMIIVYPGFSGSSLGTTSIFGVCPSTPSRTVLRLTSLPSGSTTIMSYVPSPLSSTRIVLPS